MEIKLVIDDRAVAAVRRLAALVTRRRVALGLGGAVLASAVFAFAAPISKPHTFTAGTKVVAEEVNANFDTLYAAFNERVIREDRTIALSPSEGCSGLL